MKQWRSMRRFSIFFPFGIAAIFGFNAWQDASNGKPFDWLQLGGAVGIVAFGGAVYLFCSLIFRVVLAKVKYDEGRR